MLDLFYFLINSEKELCDSAAPVLRLVGIVVFGIKVVVPIILIVVGMIDLAKAVTEKSEDNIKKAIAAVLVFLVVTIVGLLMKLVGDESYNQCMDCINDPFGKCEVSK